MRMDINDRFWAKVDKTDECWTWTGGTNGEGYGRFRVGNRKAGAHRYSYELLIGPIPIGLQIDHLCRNRLCVNPEHLECVTPSINVLRGLTPAVNRMRPHPTACPQGHPYSTENTRMTPNGIRCIICRRISKTASYWKRVEYYRMCERLRRQQRILGR